ncbi:MAG: hypothetical protein JWP92_608, partial [Caulobacter sp.]|nr:hypothetical protein [Caulobacter sp.]
MAKSKSKAVVRPLLSAHWRLLSGAAAGLAAWLAAGLTPAPATAHGLIAWNLGTLIYLVLTWRLFLTADEAKVRALAAEEDEGRSVMLLIVLAAIAASLAAVVAAMIGAKSQAPGVQAFTAAAAGVTLVMSWLLLQSVFVLHYAHRHFGGGPGKDGFGFSGQPASTY